MTTPWLSIVIPTMGRAELRHTLDSIDAQANNGAVQVLVVGDTHGGKTDDLKRAQALVYSRGPRYRWLEHDGGQHCWGQPQRQYGMEQAAGTWIEFSADDNILVPGALASIWQAICATPEPQPMLFKVRTWQAGVVWQAKAIRNGNIDADCFVVPNDQSKLGKWTNEYNGDFRFMEATAEQWQGKVAWHEDLIAVARPQPNELWFQTNLPPRHFAPPRHASV